MDPLSSKLIQAITWNDVQDVCRVGVPESETLEFKKEVPSDSAKDSWSPESPKLTTYAKGKILREVVAFSNSYGGRVVLGIDETSGEPPPRALRLQPIPLVGELERIINDVLRDSLDPRHDRLLARAILDPSDETRGVIVIEAPQSPLRPHRSKADREVYARIGTSSTVISMREVHDRVLLREEEMNRIERLFEAHRLSVPSQVGTETPLALIRFIALPALGDLRLFRPYRYAEVGYQGEMKVRIDGRPPASCKLPLQIDDTRGPIPILRGARCSYRELGTSRLLSHELYETGIVKVDYAEGRGESNVNEWTLLAFVAHGLSMLDQIRRLAQNPRAEYVVQVELAYASSPYDKPARTIPATRFPPLTISNEDLGAPLRIFYDDVRNVRGLPHTDSFEVEWPT